MPSRYGIAFKCFPKKTSILQEKHKKGKHKKTNQNSQYLRKNDSPELTSIPSQKGLSHLKDQRTLNYITYVRIFLR